MSEPESVTRLRRYVEMTHAKPLRHSTDRIHGIHTGTQWEAELRLSDLEAVLKMIGDRTEPDGLSERGA